MEKIQQVDVRRGMIRYWAAGAATWTGSVMVVTVALFLYPDIVERFNYYQLAAMTLALLGTARGSVPLRYVLAFLILIGAFLAVLKVVQLSTLGSWPITAAALTQVIPGLVMVYFIMLDNKVNAYFLNQRWRHFGERVGIENTEAEGKAATKVRTVKPGKDGAGADVPPDLDLFE